SASTLAYLTRMNRKRKPKPSAVCCTIGNRCSSKRSPRGSKGENGGKDRFVAFLRLTKPEQSTSGQIFRQDLQDASGSVHEKSPTSVSILKNLVHPVQKF